MEQVFSNSKKVEREEFGTQEPQFLALEFISASELEEFVPPTYALCIYCFFKVIN